jgi:putative inorganic carbon (HCO3(-)) transporter
VSAEALQVVGMIAAALCVAGAIAVQDRRWRAAAIALALVLSAALVAGLAWNEQLADLAEEPLLIVAAVAVAAPAVAALAVLFRARPELLPLALIAALPFRVPLDTGAETVNLLVPLYVVIAAGAAAYAWSAIRDAPAAAVRVPGLLRGALAVTLVLYAVQSAYSDDVDRATEHIGFFLVPFAVMFLLLVETRWTARLLRGALAVVVAEALIFAAIGIAQHELRFIFWNEGLSESNEFHFYFRINSLFWDSNFYGRYLAVAIIVVTAWLLWARDGRLLAGLAAILAVLVLGLAFGFSQTSSSALLAGLAVLAVLRWSLRWTAAAAAAFALLGVAGLITFGDSIEFDLGSTVGRERLTSGRSGLLEGGVELAGQRPVLGHGSGSFVVRYREENDLEPDIAAVSHTEPVTVAAEQGAVGTVVYVFLLVAAAATLLAGMRRLAPGIGDRGLSQVPRTPLEGVARIAIVAAFAVIFVHSIGYAAFLSDPITWALLAIGTALAPGVARRD